MDIRVVSAYISYLDFFLLRDSSIKKIMAILSCHSLLPTLFSAPSNNGYMTLDYLSLSQLFHIPANVYNNGYEIPEVFLDLSNLFFQDNPSHIRWHKIISQDIRNNNGFQLPQIRVENF